MFIVPSIVTPSKDGLEHSFWHRKDRNSKRWSYLETAEEFAVSLDQTPSQEVNACLELLASDLSAPARHMDSLYKAWVQRDPQRLYEAVMDSPLMRFPGIHEALIHRRNQAWLPVIRALLGSEERVLIVVGCLHYCGPGNLIELLNLDAKQIED